MTAAQRNCADSVLLAALGTVSSKTIYGFQEERVIEDIGDRLDRIYRQPPGGSPGATRSPSQLPCPEYKPVRVDQRFTG